MSASANQLEEIRLEGLGVAPGIAVGPIQMAEDVFEAPSEETITHEEIPAELAQLDEALAATRQQIEAMREKIASTAGTEDAAIFDAHLLMLEDRVLLQEVRQRIHKGQSAEAAFYSVMNRYVESLRAIDDDYLRERTSDIEDVARRVVRNLLGKVHRRLHNLPHIFVSHELSPSEAADMDREKVLGILTEVGSYTSHAAILARSMGMPCVVGLHGFCAHHHSGQVVLVDGYRGIVVINPTEETLANYAQIQKQKSALDRHLSSLRDAPSVTSDGQNIILSANIEFEHEMKQVQAAGAAGIGLYRTEFFYLKSHHLPTEEEQTQNYTRVAQQAGPEGVIVRTLDIGGDKLHSLHAGLEEGNPFLGWRGIRVCLSERALFKTQIRSILRASAHGKMRILFPMVSGLMELRSAKEVLEECRQELTAENVPFDHKIEIGAMIEIPSAAVTADLLAREVDFFSIGTNDLIQYTIAVDRGNERVADLYQPCHPAIVRLMKMVVDAAKAHGIWTGVCGEMAGDIELTPLMVGLGFEELSMAAVQLPSVKYAIRKLDAARCRQLVEKILDGGDGNHNHARVKETALEFYPELFS